MYTHVGFFLLLCTHTHAYIYKKQVHIILHIVSKLAFFHFVSGSLSKSVFIDLVIFKNLYLKYDICIESCTSCKFAAQLITV